MATRSVAPEVSYTDCIALLSGEYQSQGGRKAQEDRCVCVPDVNKLAQEHQIHLDAGVRRAFFAVFDGFGGYQSSDWLKEHFHLRLISHRAFANDPHTALQETFGKVDEELMAAMEATDRRKNGGQPHHVRSGSCATVCLIVGNELHVGNLGDSSCVLYRRKGPPAEMISFDHKASVPEERERVAAAGGTTEQKTQELQGFLCWKSREVPIGPVRVQPGGLAVSRAFGAGHAKLERYNGRAGCVVCEPAMRRLNLDAQMLCIVLASDGVWDNVRKLPDLASTLKQSITMAADVKKAAKFAAEAVVTYSLRRALNSDGQDNTSAVVVVCGAEAASAATMS